MGIIYVVSLPHVMSYPLQINSICPIDVYAYTEPFYLLSKTLSRKFKNYSILQLLIQSYAVLCSLMQSMQFML